MMDQTFINCLKQNMHRYSRNDTVTAIHDSTAEWLRNRKSDSENGPLMPVSHLADALGVARQTVQKVYLQLEAEKLIYRLPKERVWYMRQIRRSNLQNIALILPMMFSDYYQPSTEYGQRHFGVYSGIADRAMELGYALVPRRLPAPGASRSEILAAVEDLKRHYAGVIHLGSRFFSSDYNRKWLFEFASKYCDVVSINNYALQHDNFHYAGLPEDKPVMITESSIGHRTRGMFGTLAYPGCEPGARGTAQRLLLESAARHPQIVGIHHFAFKDQTLIGRWDGENYGFGLVDVTDTPYPDFVEANRSFSENLYRFRRSAQKDGTGKSPAKDFTVENAPVSVHKEHFKATADES